MMQRKGLQRDRAEALRRGDGAELGVRGDSGEVQGKNGVAICRARMVCNSSAGFTEWKTMRLRGENSGAKNGSPCRWSQ